MDGPATLSFLLCQLQIKEVQDWELRISGRGWFSYSVIRSAVTRLWFFLQEQVAFPSYPRNVRSTGGFQACGLVACDLPLKSTGPWPWLDCAGSPAPLSTWAGLAYLHHLLSPGFCFAPSPRPQHLWSWGSWETLGVDSPWLLGSCRFKTIMCADAQPLRNG